MDEGFKGPQAAKSLNGSNHMQCRGAAFPSRGRRGNEAHSHLEIRERRDIRGDSLSSLRIESVVISVSAELTESSIQLSINRQSPPRRPGCL